MSEPPVNLPPLIQPPPGGPARQPNLSRISLPPQVRLALHPASAVALLGIDNLLFGAEAITLGLAWPIVSVLAFLTTSAIVLVIQKGVQRDRLWLAAAKALVCGVLAGVPTSLTGTVFATLVLLWSGASKLGDWLGPKSEVRNPRAGGNPKPEAPSITRQGP